MGIQKKTRKFAQVKRIIGQRDSRLKKNQLKAEIASKKKPKKGDGILREMYVLFLLVQLYPPPFGSLSLFPKQKGKKRLITFFSFFCPTVRKHQAPSSSCITPPYGPHTKSSSTQTSSPTQSNTSFPFWKPSWTASTQRVGR